MNNSIDFEDPRTREQFAAIAPEIHQQTGLLFKVLLLVQWTAVFCIVFLFTQASAMGVHSLLPVLGFATIMLASVMTFAQLVILQAFRAAANRAVWNLCSSNTETIQTNKSLEEIIHSQTGELVDLKRQLLDERRQRVELQNECEMMLRRWMESGQPYDLQSTSAETPAAKAASRRAESIIGTSNLSRHEPRPSEKLLRPSRRVTSTAKV